MEGTSPVIVALPLCTTAIMSEGFEAIAQTYTSGKSVLCMSVHLEEPIIWPFLITQVLILQTWLKYKHVLNSKDLFKVFTAYFLIFVNWLTYDTHGSRGKELVDGYSYFSIASTNIHYPLLSLICQYLLLPVNSFNFPQYTPCYHTKFHVCKYRRLWMLETGSKWFTFGLC